MKLTDETRVYVRCGDCLTASMIYYRDIRPDRPWKGCLLTASCGICGGNIYSMGPVNGSRIVTAETLECLCDDRCATASGPACTCRCGGKNHGLKMEAYVVKTATSALPVITPKGDTDKARARAEEYRAAVDAAMSRVRANPHFGTYAQHINGKWVSEWSHVLEIKRLLAQIDDARDGKTHKGRMAKLSKIGG